MGRIFIEKKNSSYYVGILTEVEFSSRKKETGRNTWQKALTFSFHN